LQKRHQFFAKNVRLAWNIFDYFLFLNRLEQHVPFTRITIPHSVGNRLLVFTINNNTK